LLNLKLTKFLDDDGEDDEEEDGAAVELATGTTALDRVAAIAS